MARPKARELTDRELEVMRIFWDRSEATAAEARDALAASGLDRAYVTVANLVRGLAEKGVLTQLNSDRPYRYQSVRSFEDVSSCLLHDLLERVFGGSRELLFARLLSERRLTRQERDFLSQMLDEHPPPDD